MAKYSPRPYLRWPFFGLLSCTTCPPHWPNTIPRPYLVFNSFDCESKICNRLGFNSSSLPHSKVWEGQQGKAVLNNVKYRNINLLQILRWIICCRRAGLTWVCTRRPCRDTWQYPPLGRSSSYCSKKSTFSVVLYSVADRVWDPGWKKFGSRIDTSSATLVFYHWSGSVNFFAQIRIMHCSRITNNGAG